MRGIKYYRIKKGMTQAQLAELCGIVMLTVKRYETDHPIGLMNVSTLMIMSMALNVSISDLISEDYSDDTFEKVKMHSTISKTANPQNCISIYKAAHNLSFTILGERLGVSRQMAQTICKKNDAPQKHLENLAKFEELNVTQFCTKYAPTSAE